MPIKKITLNEYGEKQVIVMERTQTLKEAIEALQAKNYDENRAYLIVRIEEQKYQVTPFIDLMKIVIAPLGYDGLMVPLNTLPLTPANLMVRTDIIQVGRDVVDWVATHPQSRVVIVDSNGKYMGLFANTDRTGDGLFGWTTLTELAGELEKNENPYKTFARLIDVPICPKCKKQDYARFKSGEYTCQHCNYKADKPW